MRSIVAILLLVVLASAEIAPLLNANSPRVVRGSYIVVLKDGMTTKERDDHVSELELAIDAAGDSTSTVGFKYAMGSLIGFSATLSEIMLKLELTHPDVKYVEADQEFSIDYKQEKSPQAVITQTGATWGLVRTSQQGLDLTQPYLYSSEAGSGVEVYVLDTGILTTHQDFGTRASFAFSAFPNEPDTDLNGHGTHCAGTIAGTEYGIAKEATLFAVKVLSGSGGGTTATVIAGVDYVTNNHKSPAVASMSLGGGPSPTLDLAVEKSIESGVVYAIAAGNYDTDACDFSPARVSTAATVGSTTNTDERSDFSNWGTCVDIFAPGSFITSDWIGSDDATNTISGTSMATPHVAGVFALHLSVVGPLSPADNIAWLLEVATLGKITNPGTGSPNALLYSPSA